MSSLADATFVVVDIETTGLSPEKNRITEVACVLVRGGEIVGEQRTLVNPEQFIPHAIQKMTGITSAMAFAAPKGGEIFPEIRGWLPDDAIFVAHNVNFDYGFIAYEYERLERRFRFPKLCTCAGMRRRYPDRAMTVIALTGWGQAEDRRKSSEAGFDAHLVKPVDIAALTKLLVTLPKRATAAA